MNKATKQLLEENNRRGERLTPENQKFWWISSPICGAPPPPPTSRSWSTGTFWTCSRRGRPGPDRGAGHRGGLPDLLRRDPGGAARRSAGQQTVYGLSVVSLSAAVLAAIWLVFGLLEAVFQGPFTFWLPVRLGQLLGGVLIIAFAYGLVEYICRTSFEDRNPTRLQIIAVFVGIATVFLLSYLLKQVLFSLHAGIAAVLIAVLFLIYKITDRMES